MVFIFQKDSEQPDQTLWSNSKELVDKQQEIFNRLWDLAIPLSVRNKDLVYQENQDYKKKLLDYNQIQKEINSIIDLCRRELILFASNGILHKFIDMNEFVKIFVPLLRIGVTVKILTDKADDNLIRQITALNNTNRDNPIQFGYTNRLGNFNELVMLSDDKYILQIYYDPHNRLTATFSNERHQILVQEILFEKYWNEINSLNLINSN